MEKASQATRQLKVEIKITWSSNLHNLHIEWLAIVLQVSMEVGFF